MSLTAQSIGEVAKLLEVSTHTLRYYEKVGLLSVIAKDGAGNRRYDERDIRRLKFIKRAQRMNFTLDEIKQFIRMDQANALPKPEVRDMVKSKLSQIDESLSELEVLKKDLSRLLLACENSDADEACPILEGMKSES